VPEIVLFDSLSESQHSELKRAAMMFDIRRGAEDIAIKIHEHPLGSSLGTINGDDAKLLRPYGLNSRLNNALRLPRTAFLNFCDRLSFRFVPVLRFVTISAVSLSESVETTFHTTAALPVFRFLSQVDHVPGICVYSVRLQTFR